MNALLKGILTQYGFTDFKGIFISKASLHNMASQISRLHRFQGPPNTIWIHRFQRHIYTIWPISVYSPCNTKKNAPSRRPFRCSTPELLRWVTICDIRYLPHALSTFTIVLPATRTYTHAKGHRHHHILTSTKYFYANKQLLANPCTTNYHRNPDSRSRSPSETP